MIEISFEIKVSRSSVNDLMVVVQGLARDAGIGAHISWSIGFWKAIALLTLSGDTISVRNVVRDLNRIING